MQEWVKKSTTVRAGVITIVWGILMLMGLVEPELPKTIDELGKKQDTKAIKAVGLGSLASGLYTLRGRQKAQRKIEAKDEEKD